MNNMGLGDFIKKITEWLGIKPKGCDCEKRRDLLNKLLSFKKQK